MPRSNFAPWGSISLIESTCFRGQCLCRVWGPRVPESPQEKLLPNKSKKQTIMVEATGISEFSLKFTPTCQILDFTKASVNPKRSYRIQIQESTWLSLHVILKSNHVQQPLAPPLHLAFAASFLFMASVHPSVSSSLPLLSVPWQTFSFQTQLQCHFLQEALPASTTPRSHKCFGQNQSCFMH